ADEQSTEVPQPGEAAFHFVPLLVVLLPRDHRTAALGPPRVGAALSGNTPADTAAPQQVAQVTTIIPTIRYELLGPPIWASTGASDPDGIQRLPGQLHLCAVRTVQVATEWQAVAVHDEPPLRPLALPGQAHLLAALLGGHERAIQEGDGPVEFALP